jgi:hypothetical protein
LGTPRSSSETKREATYDVFAAGSGPESKNRLVMNCWELPQQLLDAIAKSPNLAFAAGNQEFEWGSPPVISEKKITVDGYTGFQSTRKDKAGVEKLMRMVYANGRLYYYGITGPGITEESELARVFFDNVKFVTGTGGPSVVEQQFPKGWTKIDKPEFSAYFSDTLGSVRTTSNTKRRTEIYTAEKGAGIQQLTLNIYDEATFQATDKTAGEMYDSAESVLKAFDSKILSSKPITVDGVAGRAIAFKTGSANVVLMVVVLSQNRFYNITISDKDITEESPLYKRFIENIKLKPSGTK